MSDVKEYAFPTPAGQLSQTLPGMTLRDYFAAAALTGILSYPGGEGNGSAYTNNTPAGVAESAYCYADAMIAARKSPESA